MEMARCQQYIDALEEERRKIQVFQRELPLCLQLVTQAIEACRQQLATEITSGPSESEETSSEGPVFEEFMPIKKESIDTQKKNQKEDGDDDGKGEKPDWLRSVQLWTTDFEASAKEDAESCPRSLSLANKKTGAFHPFCKERRPQSVAVISSSSPDSPSIVATPSSTGKQDEKEDKSQKKSRRCWSPELHHRFLHALHQLGGSHAATPKQIRELMKVDGLTNDEVKSHLQKYRLHTRRVPSNASIPMSNSQPTQFVVVGGIWVPPEFATVASSGPSGQAPETALSTVYAPSAKTPSPSVTTRVSAPQLKKESQLQPSEDPSSPSPRRGGDRSGSRGENSMGEDAISSSAVSSHTTTTTATFPAQ